ECKEHAAADEVMAVKNAERERMRAWIKQTRKTEPPGGEVGVTPEKPKASAGKGRSRSGSGVRHRVWVYKRTGVAHASLSCPYLEKVAFDQLAPRNVYEWPPPMRTCPSCFPEVG